MSRLKNNKTIAFSVNKGGVGKTTSTCAIGQILDLAEYEVLIIDNDPQGNTSRNFGIKEDLPGLDYESLYCRNISKEEVEKFIVPTNFGNIDIIPSSSQLFEMDILIHEAKKQNPKAILCFKENLEHIKANYDFILIDNAPAINNLSNSSIAVSDLILIPINADNMSYEGISLITRCVENLNNTYNLSIKFGGVFMTRVNTRTVLYKDLSNSYIEQLGDYFIPVAISENIAVAEANTAFVPLYSYSRKCTAFIDYVKLIAHFNIMDKKHYQKVLDKVTN